MSISVIEKIEVNASPSEVAKILFDPNQDIRWISGLREIREIEGFPLNEGSTIHRIADFAGKEIDYILEVKKYIPDHFVEFEDNEKSDPHEYPLSNYRL